MSKEKNGYMEKFKEFINTVRGKKDPKSRADVLANPDNLATMSILTQGQVEFCSIAGYVAGVKEWGGLFEGLNDYAEKLKAHSISKGGRGREQVIQYEASLSESKFLKQLGFTVKEGGKNE